MVKTIINNKYKNAAASESIIKGKC